VKLNDRGAAGGWQNVKTQFSYYKVYFLLAFLLACMHFDCITKWKGKKMTKQEYLILFIFGAAVIVAALNIDALMVL